MILAVAAVACLSSIILQWSAHFPDEHEALQHPLFGDLVEEGTATPQAIATPLVSTATAHFRTVPVSPSGQSASVAPRRVEPIDISEDRRSLPLPRVRFTAPMAVRAPAPAEPSELRTVSHSSMTEENTDWHHGTIEQSPHEHTIPARPSGNIVQLGKIIIDE